jgi:Tfp pilus assembly protein PilF
VSALLSAALLAAASDCTPIAAEPRPDPDTARAYLAVAQEELSRGQPRSAAAAFRGALRYDASSREARLGLERLCRDQGFGGDDAELAQAVALMDAGDRRGAVARFEALRQTRPHPGAALLEGICLYELGEDAPAEILFLEAKEEPELAASAELFLGLLALRRGDGRGAEERFIRASGGEPALRTTAAKLLELSAREGKLVAGALVGGGYDSNVELLPGSAAPSGSQDASFLFEVSALARPLGQSGPYARLFGGYRKEVLLPAYDTGTVTAVAGWQLARAEAKASLDYSFEFLVFGGAPSLVTHGLGLRGQLPLGLLFLEAGYSVRFQNFLAQENTGYSGTLHSVRLSVGIRPSGRWGLEAGYAVARDAARLAELASFGHGPILFGWVGFTDDVRLVASARSRHRQFDAVDPDFELTRTDDAFDVSTRVELDLGKYVTLFAAFEARAVFSNVPALTSSRLAAWLGSAFSARLF